MTRATVESPAPARGTAEGRSRFVHAGFVAAAARYDGLTRLFSFGLDGWWRRACLRRCELRSGQALLDVATGTGELAIHARRRLGDRGVAVGLDFCAGMLAAARRKRPRDAGLPVAWVEGRAEALPFPPETFDRVTVGFALRHLDLAETLREIARVLKPGGRFVVVEWTRPEGLFARRLLLGYMRRVVPPLVGVLSRDPRVAELARYLPDSIEAFVSGDVLTRRIGAAGLAPAGRWEYLRGLVSICVGVKGDPGGTAQDRSAHGVTRLAPAAAGEGPRQKWWVILAGALVLGIVAVQMLVGLIQLLSR